MSITSYGADLSQIARAVALQSGQARLSDFAALMKPRVMSARCLHRTGRTVGCAWSP